MSDTDKPGMIGRIKDKLIASKQQWARDGRLLTGHSAPPSQRLPPGQRLTQNWPVLDLGVQPDIPKAAWRLDIDGMVEQKLSLNWGEYTDLPRVRIRSDIHCVTAWSRYDNDWEGVSALEIVRRVRPLPDARYLVFHSHDGYTTNVALEHFAQADVLLADRWMGEEISREHGGPLRVVIPRFYFWKSAKWLRRIEFVAIDKPGFWELRGYHNEGDPWLEQRYDTEGDD